VIEEGADGCLVEGSWHTLERKPPRVKEWTLNEETFDQLLTWLHEDREQAGRKYEEIRSTLIKCFKSHGCPEAEELADKTIDRVTRKLPQLRLNYVGDPARYFYGVAHNIHLEHLRQSQTLLPLPPRELQGGDQAEDVEPLYECLEHCMKLLEPHQRELVLNFYQGEKGAKIRLRKELARKLSIQLANLRLQAFRIRADLKKCIRGCMEQRAIG
jgi:DNA-directed RNA polymerase specialized sigma24 family protein